MFGIAVQIDGLATHLRALEGVASGGLPAMVELKQGLGDLLVEQTRTRLEIEKTSPDGVAWPRTTDDRGALFVTGEHLARSIDRNVEGDGVEVGSGWVGARIHQFGGVIEAKGRALVFAVGGKTVFAKKVTIPARPYLGISPANAIELEHTAQFFLSRAFGLGGA
ncbi:MAG: phage virion morphogenesis protein [Hyphomicrobiales bacterium]|nr:phage virion morphogenesis protein [Hyphomicrobiales bacterium]MDE2113829.1 phage virion morphogenesis protein [Hyphomicrobiales bacterium]